VLDQAFTRPVSVRDGKTGQMMLMIPHELIDRTNLVSDCAVLLCRVVIECQRPDPSTAVLGPAAFISRWSSERKTQFIRGLAEAVAEAANTNDASAVNTYLEVMSHADDQPLPQFDSASGTAADRKRVKRHIAQRSRVDGARTAV
jgi:uncharacterized protein with NRDE domain